MVNDTDHYQTVLANTIVGQGAVTQVQEDLAETLSQVGADQDIQRIYGVRVGGRGDLSDAPLPRLKLTKNF